MPMRVTVGEAKVVRSPLVAASSTIHQDAAVAASVVGTVSELWRFPVKSMLGEVPPSVVIGADGVVGDRRYALIDDETNKVVSVKRPSLWGRMFELRATTTVNGNVQVTLLDGDSFDVEDPALAQRLTEFFGRGVRVASSPPPNASFEEVWVRDLKNDVDPYFGAARVVDGEEVIEGGQTMTDQGSFVNFGAVHLVTTATAGHLASVAPGSRFDPHRFRPNIVIATDRDGFVETSWVGQELLIGDVRLSVNFNVPRCVMVTLSQDDLPADRAVLRTISDHNAIDVLGNGTSYPCVGVYADVVDPGTVRIGDEVSVAFP